MKRVWHVLGPLLVLAIFLAACWMLYLQLKGFSYHDFRESLRQFPTDHMALAAGLTALNYLILVGYDWLAVRFLRLRLALGKIALASFIGYVTTYNFGVLVGGTPLRYRLYSAWGLSTLKIVQLIALLNLSFWLGLFALAGVVFVVHPLPVPRQLDLPFADTWTLGLILTVSTAVYLATCALLRRPLRLWGWEVYLPTLRMSLAQIAVAWADFCAAAAVLYVLLPADIHMPYLSFLAVYLLAVTLATLAHVPGGLGVFELSIIVLLAPHKPHGLVAALMVYRAVYYWLPLVAAGVMLGIHEIVLQRERLRKIAGALGQLTPAVVPTLLALLTFIAGAVLLFSGALPIGQDRAGWIRQFLPLSLVETSHFLGSVDGLALLIVAHGLLRRRDAAYWLGVLLLALGVLFSLLKGLHYEEAVVLAAILAVLLPSRGLFRRKGSLFQERLEPGWMAAIALVLVCTVWLGLFSYKHVEYGNELWWQFAFGSDAPRFLRASVGVAVLFMAFALMWLLRPASPRPVLPDQAQLDVAAAIAAASPQTRANLALLGDKMFLFSEDRRAMLMYGIRGRSWVALGDPVGPRRAHEELVWRFHDLCDAYSGWTVFYQVAHDHRPLYLDLGLSLLKLGEEARVPLAQFSLEGGARKGLRKTRHRLQREGCRLEVIPAQAVPGALPELRRISDAWLAAKGGSEKGFSLGFFDERYLRRFPAAVIRQDGRMVAFVNLWCGCGKEELSVDLMRHLPDAPEGTMEFLFIELMLWGQREGYHAFNLGMAPFSGLRDRQLKALWNRVGAAVFRHGEPWYHFQGLRHFKEKFDPQWRPKYLAVPNGMVLPRILADLARLIAGGPGG